MRLRRKSLYRKAKIQKIIHLTIIVIFIYVRIQYSILLQDLYIIKTKGI